MRKFFFSLTAAASALGFAAEASAQYNPYAAQQATARYAPQAYGVQPVSTAMRPGTTTYAATPAVGLKPINAPSAATQRVLMASRTGPTPAPAPAAGAMPPRPAAPAAAPQQYWNSNSGGLGWEPSQGAAYGAGGPAAPQPDPNIGGYGAPAGGYDAPAGGACGNNGGGYAGGDCGGCAPACGHCCCLGRHCLLRTTGDLVQHMPHFGTTHGYYYFRPYHVMHVFSQQELATRWGGDPRNPYDNTMFQGIYQQMGVDLATEKARADADAKNAAKGNSQAVQEYVVPTPMPNYPVPQYGPPGQETIVPPGAIPQGVVPQGPVPMPGPAVEYVPNR